MAISTGRYTLPSDRWTLLPQPCHVGRCKNSSYCNLRTVSCLTSPPCSVLLLFEPTNTIVQVVNQLSQSYHGTTVEQRNQAMFALGRVKMPESACPTFRHHHTRTLAVARFRHGIGFVLQKSCLGPRCPKIDWEVLLELTAKPSTNYLCA